MNREINELRKEYLEQDNRCTAFPIFVTVQELVFVGVIHEDYDVICPYGDGEIRIEKAYNPETDENDGEEIKAGYIWHDVEWFLTVKGAEEFIKANRHNLAKEVRTYVHHFEGRNFEMRELLNELGFVKSLKERT